MYVRVFHDLWASSIMKEAIPVRWLFVTLLAMADKNRSGIVDVPLFILAREAGMSEVDTREALTVLMAPDTESRSEKEDGRRVIPLRPERGWEIVNWQEYAEQYKAVDRRRQIADAVARHKQRAKNATPQTTLPLEDTAEVINGNHSVNIFDEGRGGKGSSSPKVPSISEEVGPSSPSKKKKHTDDGPLSDWTITLRDGTKWRVPISAVAPYEDDLDGDELEHEMKTLERKTAGDVKLKGGRPLRPTARGASRCVANWLEMAIKFKKRDGKK